jgi:hypothetical protein
LFSLPPPTKMFQFGGFPLHKEHNEEVLFRDLRIRDCVRLPGAYRSLPRPSSALKPSHPSHSVVTSKLLPVPQLESEPIHGVIAASGVQPVAAMPFTPDISFGSCIS